MYSFWTFFLQKNNFTYLLTVVLVFVGFGALLAIPKESAPEVRIPIAVVSTALPGASADDVEELLTIPIEDRLASGLSEVKTITSTSREGVSSVVAEFLPNADLDESVQEVRDVVDTVTDLPVSATDPVVTEVNFVDQPIVEFSLSSDLPLTELRTLAEQVEERIERVAGVSRVGVSGVAGREVQVVVRREALDRYSLTLGEVVSGLQSSNQAVPVGGLVIDQVQYAVRLEGDIKNLEDVRNLPIASRSGVPIYVRDIAFVSDGLGATQSFARLSTNQGAPQQALSFSVFKQVGSDVTRVSGDVLAAVRELESGILAGSDVFVLFNTGDDVRGDLRQLATSGLQTVVLVVVVLLLALGAKEALLAGLAIPLSFLIAFIGLNASGNTVNFVSLFALILAVGILVDSVIVVTEGIHTHLRNGLSPMKATQKAIRELHWPIVAGTMTTVAVFFPLFFISGVTGKFIASIPFTIIFVLIASLFVALGLVPVFAKHFLKDQKKPSSFAAKREHLTERLQMKYRTLLEQLLGDKKRERRLRRWSIGLLIVSLMLPALGLVQTQFFPGEDAEYLFIDLEQNQGTALLATDLLTREAEQVLLEIPEIEAFITTVGSLSSFTAGTSGTENANISAVLADRRDRSSAEVGDDIRVKIEHALPNTTVRILELSSGPPVGSPISVSLLGEDPSLLSLAAYEVAGILETVEGVRDIDVGLEDDGLDFVFEVNRAEVAAVGLDVATIASTMRTALFGVDATSVRVNAEEIDVRVRLDLSPDVVDINNNVETTIDALENIQVPLRTGGTVLLGSLVEVRLAPANATIFRQDQEREVSVTADVEDGVNVNVATQAFLAALDEQFEAPEGVELDFGGENEETTQSFIDLGFALIYGVLLIIAILVVQFNSFRKAFMIISILPMIIIGIFFGLALSGQAISFPSIMGFIAVAGIAVNNSIILIDVMNELVKENPTWTPKKIAIEGGIQRLRPILLTTITTVIGVVPLTYASAIWAPLAWSIIFGLTFTAALTLVLIPISYRRYLAKRG